MMRWVRKNVAKATQRVHRTPPRVLLASIDRLSNRSSVLQRGEISALLSNAICRVGA